MTKIVILCTSAPELQGHPTGVWLEEVATPYYLFQKQGYEVVIASTKGGPIPIDANSLGPDFFTDESKQFLHDATAMGAFCHSVPLESIALETVDALYLAGGHGVCVDFVNNPGLKKAIEDVLFVHNKIVAADCHGPIGLSECQTPEGTPLVQGKTVTGFTDTEEDAVQLTALVPYLIETRFKEQGANFEKADDWNPKVCVDGKLVTGQNPQSSNDCAKAVIDLLSA